MVKVDAFDVVVVVTGCVEPVGGGVVPVGGGVEPVGGGVEPVGDGVVPIDVRVLAEVIVVVVVNESNALKSPISKYKLACN